MPHEPPLPAPLVAPKAAPAAEPTPEKPRNRFRGGQLLVAALFGVLLGISVPPPWKGTGLPRNELPTLSIDVDLLAQYSVAFALLINVLGFVIAAYHYSRRGVSPTSIPLRLMWGAGFTFVLLTGFYLHVGYEAFRLMHSTVPAEANWYLGLAVVFTMTLRRYFLTRVGSMVYFIPCLAGGALLEKGWLAVRTVPQMTAHSFQLPLPAVALVFGFGLVIAYARLVYPVLLRSVGGGAYQPVVIAASDEYRAFLSPGSYVYEVLTTSDSIYLEVETISPHSTPAPWFSGPYTWRNWHRVKSTRYLQLPRAAVRCVEYTDPMELARPVGENTPGSPPPGGLLSQPPADICLPTGEARKQ